MLFSLIIGPRGLQCETNLYEIMGWESSDVVRFDLGPPSTDADLKVFWSVYCFTTSASHGVENCISDPISSKSIQK